ncbi:MAG TPA: formyltetrahydrofolate deformylase [Mycobacteriales bacterium]|nr:formyltetrahydrofolate deformylase [Mycobacteriales bacterium]
MHAVLTLSCPDRVGIVHAVTGLLAEHGCNIVDSSQFGAADTGLFFMRVHVQATDDIDVAGLRAAFAPVGDAYGMDWQLHDRAARERVVVLVSKLGHCLNDLLYRHSTGALRADLVAVVSNHPDFRGLVEAHGVPFHHVPVPPGGKAEAEARLLEIVAAERAELVVLARYMQVLSDDLCARLPDTINIHHSFLPSFKGARPYHQAYERGVKLIGATAHYVTAELDEGPIIEQEVARVDHAATPERLVEVGRDLECIALARAVAWHLDHRVLRNGARTVVFP